MATPPDVSADRSLLRAVGTLLRDGNPHGTVFLVGPSTAVTATHVIGEPGPGAVVSLQFAGSPALLPATVTGWLSMSSPGVGTDIAILTLASPLTEVAPWALDDDEPGSLLELPLVVVDPSAGLLATRATAVDMTVRVEPDGVLTGGIEIDLATQLQLSGAPLVRPDSERVAGMVVAGSSTTVYCVPAEQIRRALAEGGPPPASSESAATTTTEAPSAPAPAEWVPGYVSDTAEGRDQLGMTADVRALAALVASRALTPPASIGLFGDWGSGKSFFMRQMRQRIALLADRSRTAEEAAAPGSDPATVSAYCAGISQITFNAWHYADTNLWASLAAHIFDSLAAPDGVPDPEDRERATLQDRLQEREVQRRLLAGRVAALESEQARLAEKRVRSVLAVATDAVAVQDLSLLSSRFGLDDPTVEQLRSDARDLTSAAGKLRQFWAELRHGDRRSWVPVVAAIGVSLLVLAVVAVVTRLWSPAWLVPGVVALSASIAAAARPVAEVTGALSRLVRRVDERQKEALAPLVAQHRQAQRELAGVDAEIEQLAARAADLDPAQRLQRFLADREASPDYRSHFGVVAMARRDFELLARLLARERTAAGAQPLERIVLYVDDLDRCPPDTVVKVLEAVHLLLALPLFVVVVAVDPRWLLRAVERHYRTMLTSDGAERRAGRRLAATAQDYLEKIFQIPYALPTMGPTGFARLMAQSLRPSAPARSSALVVEAAAGVGAGGTGAAQAAGNGAPLPGATPVEGAPEVTGVADVPEVVDLRPSALLVEEHEVALLSGLAPLIPTPRAAKRLANVYQLARVQVPAAELPAFVGTAEAPGRCAPTMLLLAVLVGLPAEADDFFRLVAGADGGTLLQDLAVADGDVRPGEEDDERLERGLRAVVTSDPRWPRQVGAYQPEIPRVFRFSFHTAALLAAGASSAQVTD